MLALLLAAAMPVQSLPGDQTDDVALVARYLHAIRGDAGAGSALLVEAPTVIDSRTQEARPLDAFVRYANACQIKEIRAVPVSNGRRMPVGVTWGCGPRATQERTASFWFDGDRISKISWGKPMVIQAQPMRKPSGQN